MNRSKVQSCPAGMTKTEDMPDGIDYISKCRAGYDKQVEPTIPPHTERKNRAELVVQCCWVSEPSDAPDRDKRSGRNANVCHVQLLWWSLPVELCLACLCHLSFRISLMLLLTACMQLQVIGQIAAAAGIFWLTLPEASTLSTGGGCQTALREERGCFVLDKQMVMTEMFSSSCVAWKQRREARKNHLRPLYWGSR